MTLAFHEFANLFPTIEGQEFFDLAEDIRLNGLRERIELLGPEILDGRNRYRALVWIASSGEPLGAGWDDGLPDTLVGKPFNAQWLAADPDDDLFGVLFKVFNPEIYGDPLTYVLSKNLTRRHLTDDQRRMVGARLVTMKAGRPAEDKTSQIANITRESAADIVSADVAGLDRARSVIAHGVADVVEAVDAGRISVAAAAKIAAQPRERQAEIFASLPRTADGKLAPDTKKALAPVIAEIRAERNAAKRERRAEREIDLGRRLQSLPEKSFGVAIEDFEWDHEVYSRDTGGNRHPSMHYETAADAHTPEEIVARCAERFACIADDAILFKWTTLPHAYIAMQVMALQGFRYVTQLVWNKERIGERRGHGYWFTGEHEIVLVGTRGKVVPPAFAHFRSNFSAPVGEHSEKPPNIHEIVEFHWPNVPKVEFNARVARPGWTAWGFDAPEIHSALTGNAADVVIPDEIGLEADDDGQTVSHETESVVERVPPIDVVIGTAGDYAILPGPAFVPRDFLTQGEVAALAEHERLPLMGEPVDPQALPLDLPEQRAPDPVEIVLLNDVVAVCRRELTEDEFSEWQALNDVESLAFVVSPDMARHVLGEGLAVDGADGLKLTAAGQQRLRALRAYVERCERRHGRTLGYSLDINPPSQVDIEDLLRGAA